MTTEHVQSTLFGMWFLPLPLEIGVSFGILLFWFCQNMPPFSFSGFICTSPLLPVLNIYSVQQHCPAPTSQVDLQTLVSGGGVYLTS